MLQLRSTIAKVVVLGLLAALAMPASTQSLREPLFREADAALAKARDLGADLLAPRSFAKGLEYYEDAEQRFERGRELASIQSDLKEATNNFNKAIEATNRAGVAMATLLKTRSDAKEAGARRYAGDLWLEGEELLQKIAVDNELGRDKGVARQLPAAEAAFREAELIAIKASYLSETRRLLEEADDKRVKRYAPKTLANAKALLAQAETALTEDRYDTDLPRSLARQAQYQVEHSIYLAQELAKVRKDKVTMEDIILDWELPIKRIAGTADMVARFDKGYEPPTENVISYIEGLQNDNRTLNQELNDRNVQISQLQGQVAELERRLGGVAEERVALSMQLERQAEARQRYARVGQMFGSDEAKVLRDGEIVIIRLIGLGFDVGKAEIQIGSLGLLEKLKAAIEIFPDADVVVEGHTDSFGGDALNLSLSEQRAQAVMGYLLTHSSLQAARAQAIGYGETRPIGNNETQEGRAKNRRIDVAIVPAVGET